MTQVLEKLSEKSQSHSPKQAEISHMTQLKDKLSEKIQAFRPRTAKLTKEYADVVIDKVDIGQCMGGARDVKCLVTDISYLDAQEGIRALPRDSHPMVMLSSAILVLQKDSKFAAYYNAGKFNKMNAWEPVYEDASDLVARIPVIAAFIYNLKYKGDKQIPADPNLDLGGNFARMMGQSAQ